MGSNLKKILLVAMPESIHTARWISQFTDQGWQVHLFPSVDIGVTHPMMSNIIVHHSIYSAEDATPRNIEYRGVSVPSPKIAFWGREIVKKFVPGYRALQLKRLIEWIEPDAIHSLEMQQAGYLTLEAKKITKGAFPPWIVTNWGSDIFLFGRLPWHEPRIREVLRSCDYYSCECRRDVCMAKYYGFEGTVLPVFPNTGGFDIAACCEYRRNGAVSERKSIMLKGYQGWAGRALVGLRALERCADILQGYRIYIHSSMCDEVVIAAELFRQSTSIPVEFVTPGSPHETLLKLHGESRISIGLSISDGISTSLLEAMLMGSFPIQSHTACADEWVEHGRTGMLVHPDDPDDVETAIRRALQDDDLVNSAAQENFALIKERLDSATIKRQTIDYYLQVFDAGNKERFFA
jgi:glycosyl transferase family 1/glycosyl transferase family 4